MMFHLVQPALKIGALGAVLTPIDSALIRFGGSLILGHTTQKIGPRGVIGIITVYLDLERIQHLQTYVWALCHSDRHGSVHFNYG
jgi:hypothetical protein